MEEGQVGSGRIVYHTSFGQNIGVATFSSC